MNGNTEIDKNDNLERKTSQVSNESKNGLKNYSKAMTTECDENSNNSPSIIKPIDESIQQSDLSFRNFLTQKQKSSKIIVYGIDLKIKSPIKIGGVYSLCYVNSQPLIILGPGYIIGIGLPILIMFGNIFFFYFTFHQFHSIIKTISLLFAAFQSIIHWIVILSNPGIPSRSNYISDEILKIIAENSKYYQGLLDKFQQCERCNIIVHTEDNVGHCEECGICYLGQSHHCIWIGKCLGRSNRKVFSVFLIATFMLIIYYIFLLVIILI